MKFDQDLQDEKVLVVQVRSAITGTSDVRGTLKALGLGRIGKKKEHLLNPCIWGMLRKVHHLVQVTKVA
ncbi:MAG: 50S ribosomal protein L30 [Bdellovibrionota bacterium]|jgi:large subunit ribosomal protein L30